MNLAKHTLHTRWARIHGLQIPAYLIEVSLASELPSAGKGLPCPFSLVWVPLQVFGQRQEFDSFR